MRFTLSIILAFLSVKTASSIALAPRAVNGYTTITNMITSATVVQSPTTINTAFGTPGVQTLIPDALTVTINDVPAYLYLETSVPVTSITTLYSTTKVKTKTKSSTATTSTTASSTISVAPAINSAISQCATEGVNNGMVIGYTNSVSNFLQCDYQCGSITYCIVFSFNSVTSQCTMYEQGTGSYTPNTTSNEFFASKESNADTCYQSATATSTPTPLPSAQVSALNTCFTEARDTESVVIETTSSPDILSCSAVCSSDANCDAYSYSYDTDECTTYSSIAITAAASDTWFGYKGNGSEECYENQYPQATMTASTSSSTPTSTTTSASPTTTTTLKVTTSTTSTPPTTTTSKVTTSTTKTSSSAKSSTTKS